MQILEEYNDSNTPMNLVLFDDALDHLTRIHRVIRMDRGHALLVGVGESFLSSGQMCDMIWYMETKVGKYEIEIQAKNMKYKTKQNM